MTDSFSLVKPNFIPPMDDEFCPAVLANRAFEQGSAAVSVPLIIGLERDDGKLSRFEARVFPDNHPRAEANLYYAERMLKFLLWQRGGRRVYVGGSRSIGDYLQNCYAPGGKRDFDYHFMSEQVYEKPFTVELCEPEQVPPANDVGEASGRHLDGCRTGFDLGASDRKVTAVIDGRVVFSEEVVGSPRSHSDPEYHYCEIITAIKTAASKMPRVDAIGGSSAGIFIDNRPMVASLFRVLPPEHFHEIRHLFLRISRDELNIPLEVINDGDVTALAGSMSLEDNGILGIAMAPARLLDM